MNVLKGKLHISYMDAIDFVLLLEFMDITVIQYINSCSCFLDVMIYIYIKNGIWIQKFIFHTGTVQ